MSQEEIKKIIQEKVIGVWEECHDTTGHKYRNTKTWTIQRSVTTKIGGVVNKPHLLNWAVKMGAEWLLQGDRINRIQTGKFKDDMIKGMQLAHADIRDNAGGVGSVAHDMADRYCNEFVANGVLPEDITKFAPENCDPRSIASARAVEKWFRKNNPIPICNEIIVGNDKYSAGKLDLMVMIGNELVLIDYKTSNGIDQDGYSMQTSAYKYFFEEMTGLKVKKTKILHLSKDYDKFEVYLVKNLATAYKSFKAVCALYDWKYGKKDKIVKDIKRLKI